MHFFISLIALIGLTFVAAKPQIIGSSNVGCLGECNDVYAQCADTSDTSSGLEAYFEAGGCDTIYAQCNSNCNTGEPFIEPLTAEPGTAEPETAEPEPAEPETAEPGTGPVGKA